MLNLFLINVTRAAEDIRQYTHLGAFGERVFMLTQPKDDYRSSVTISSNKSLNRDFLKFKGISYESKTNKIEVPLLKFKKYDPAAEASQKDGEDNRSESKKQGNDLEDENLKIIRNCCDFYTYCQSFGMGKESYTFREIFNNANNDIILYERPSVERPSVLQEIREGYLKIASLQKYRRSNNRNTKEMSSCINETNGIKTRNNSSDDLSPKETNNNISSIVENQIAESASTKGDTGFTTAKSSSIKNPIENATNLIKEIKKDVSSEAFEDKVENKNSNGTADSAIASKLLVPPVLLSETTNGEDSNILFKENTEDSKSQPSMPYEKRLNLNGRVFEPGIEIENILTDKYAGKHTSFSENICINCFLECAKSLYNLKRRSHCRIKSLKFEYSLLSTIYRAREYYILINTGYARYIPAVINGTDEIVCIKLLNKSKGKKNRTNLIVVPDFHRPLSSLENDIKEIFYLSTDDYPLKDARTKATFVNNSRD